MKLEYLEFQVSILIFVFDDLNAVLFISDSQLIDLVTISIDLLPKFEVDIDLICQHFLNIIVSIFSEVLRVGDNGSAKSIILRERCSKLFSTQTSISDTSLTLIASTSTSLSSIVVFIISKPVHKSPVFMFQLSDSIVEIDCHRLLFYMELFDSVL